MSAINQERLQLLGTPVPEDHRVTPALVTDQNAFGNPSALGQRPTQPRALVFEDIREACVELRRRRYECDRLTHNELMTITGEEYTGKLLK